MPRVDYPCDLLQKQDGEQVIMAAGKLKCLWDYKTGTSTKGASKGKPWMLQNGVLQGDDGAEIPIKFDGRSEIPANWRGKKIIVSSVKGDKGFTGVKMVIDREALTVKVTASAKVELGEDAPASAPTPAPAPSATEPVDDGPPVEEPPPSTAYPVEPPKGKDPEKELASLKKDAFKVGLAYVLATDTAVYCAEQMLERHGREMSDAHFQACVSTVFIALDRRGAIDRIPAKPLPPPKSHGGEQTE